MKIGYARVSTEEQDGASQRREIGQYLEREGFDLRRVQWFVDKSTGDNLDRPAFDELDKLIERAMRKQGFALVEAVSYCHTTFGRANDMKSPVKMMRLLKDQSITIPAAEKLGDELPPDRIVRGVFHDEDKPEFTELYDRIIEQAHGPLAPRKRKVRRGWV